MEKIKVIRKKPNNEIEVVEMNHTIKDFQKYVKGLVEFVSLPKGVNIDIICNDNFLNEEMEPNFVLPERVEIICGPVIIAGYDPETGHTVSLTDKQMKVATDYLANNSVYNMSIRGAYRYVKVLRDYQKDMEKMNHEREI